MKTIKRALALLLVVAMVLSMCITTTFAEGEGKTATKITAAKDFVTGDYIVVADNGYALNVVDGTWVTYADLTKGVDANTAPVWKLTVDGSSVKLADANGTKLAPKGGNSNGISTKEYGWAWTFADGQFVFAGTGSDTVYLANNPGDPNGHAYCFRGYKTSTVDKYPDQYPHHFSLYKVEKSETVAPATLNLKTVSELSKNMYKYGHIDVDISTADFLKTFAYGDVVTVTVNGYTFDTPVCSNYDDVDANCYLIRAESGNAFITLAINYGRLGVVAGMYELDGSTYKLVDGVELPLDVTVTMKTKGGYFAEWDARQLPERTNNREDYASDAIFANFRNVATTGMGENALYRSSSPVNPEIGRNTYADKLAEEAGIKTFINLADSKEAAEAYEGYAESYYSTQNVVFLNLPAAYTSDEFKSGLAVGIKAIGTGEGPYLEHCTEGKDRAGITAGILEALMGASADEIIADYLVTYQNYFFFNTELTAEKANSIANAGIIAALKALFGVEDLSTADLAAEASAFLKEIGLTDAEIAAVKANLAKDYSPWDRKVTIGGTELNVWFTKYGNTYCDCTSDHFLKTEDNGFGFEYGDIVTVKFLGQELHLPVVSNYSDVDSGLPCIKVGGTNQFVEFAINMGNFGSTYGLVDIVKNADGTYTITAKDGVTFPVEISFEMYEKGGYLSEYLMHQLSRSNNREDYAELSDAEFANFRVVDTTGMGENVLYRGSSPINPEIGRNTYADAALAEAGATVIMNLADSDEIAKAYPGFADSYYAKQNVIYLNLGVDFAAADFKAGLANGLKFFAEHEGTYYVHCSEGKDRAGFVSALLECLMGATYDEVVADYMETYYNYYGVEVGSEQYNAIANSNIIKTLANAFGVEDLSKADLAAGAEAYIKGIGLTDTEIAALKANLGEESYEGKTVILHSNDVHGSIDGYKYMAGLRDKLVAQGAEVILADAGDYSQGTCYVSTSKGADAIAMMNKVGYDVATIGNHEFDYGWAQLKTNMADASFKVLCADVFENGETIFDGHTIIEKGGVKIGFFGLETPEAQTKANPALIQGLTFLAEEEMYACAQTEVNALKAEGADIIIGLTHLGVDAESEPNRSYDLYANIEGVDMIIDGHSHTVMTEGANGEAIQSTGTAFANIGVIVIDNAAKKIVDNKLVAVDDKTPVNETVAAAAKEIIDRVDAEYGEVFASSEVELNGDKAPNGNRDSETNLGDLITDSMLWAATKEEGSIKVDKDHVVALTNGGGIRAWIHKGDITKKDVNTVLPFGNTVALVYVSGAELLEALEASTYCTPTAVGGFPQVSGIDFTVKSYLPYDQDADTYPGSTYYGPTSINRVVINSINGQPFSLTDTYAVVTNNFCAAGGDTYYAFAAATEQFDTGVPMDEALMAYITDVLGGVVGEKYAAPQGRIDVETLEGKTVILHSNDVHGSIDGYKYMAGLKADFEKQGAEVVLADAGDYSQGTCYVSTSKGADAIAMMNKVGYDVATIGNHEFDYGWAQLQENMSKAAFEVLCADVFENGETIFDGHTIIEKGGVKIGFFGLETPEAQTKANPALIQGLTFLAEEEMYACAQTEINALKAEGADVIIALAHLGVDAESEPNRSYDLYANIEGVDMIIDGHSHTVMTSGSNGEAIQSTGTAFANIGIIVIDNESKKIVDNSLYEIDNAAPVDEVVAAAAKEIIDRVDAEYGEVFASSEVELNGDKAPNGNRDSETNLGDLITDSMLWAATKEEGSIKVDKDHVVALTNGGGIRAWIHKGDITKKDVNTVLPFGNTVALVYVSGAELLEALEASTYCTPTAVGGFPQVSGIDFSIHTYKAFDEGELYPGSTYSEPNSIQRVVINSINGQPFSLTDTYAVVTNNFCAAGGDTYYAFAAATEQFDTGVPMDEALMAYITDVLGGVVGEEYAAPQGRITIVDKATFTDVATDAWYYDYVMEAYEQGLMSGVGDDLFAPLADMSRAMVVTVLYNIAGEPALDEAWAEPFTDVNETDWFYAPIVWAYNEGIVSGTGANTFEPNAGVNRAQIAVMLDNYDHEYLGKAAADVSGVELAFSDAAAIPAWATGSVKYCVSAEYVHGYEDGTYRPLNTLIRVECVVLVLNLAAAK